MVSSVGEVGPIGMYSLGLRVQGCRGLGTYQDHRPRFLVKGLYGVPHINPKPEAVVGDHLSWAFG